MPSNTSGSLAGPKLIAGNLGEFGYQLPDGSRGTINNDRVGFSYTFRQGKLIVFTDLDSDVGLHRVWSNRNPGKALSKARQRLGNYGVVVSIATLLADGWTNSPIT